LDSPQAVFAGHAPTQQIARSIAGEGERDDRCPVAAPAIGCYSPPVYTQRVGFVVALYLAVGCTATPATPSEEDASKASASADKPAEGDAKAEDGNGRKANTQGRQGLKQVPPPEDLKGPPSDAIKTESGLVYKVLRAGTSDDRPALQDRVEVNYTGWNAEGETYDTTEGRKSRNLLVNQMIQGWAEGMQLMHPGEKARLWIPAELGFEQKNRRPKGPVVIDVELLAVQHAPPTPPDVAAIPSDAVKTESGLAYRVLQPGTGPEKPRAWDRVTLSYAGWTSDGKLFDSTALKERPAKIRLDSPSVVPGWIEALTSMTVGEKRRIWIPESLGPRRPGTPKGMLVYDLELLEVVERDEPPPPPEVPADVAAPPKDAKKTASGLAYKVLTPGKGKDHPTAASRVKVHYSGWTTDGKQFDSSVTRGKPAEFGLGQVIKGWTEGVQLMVQGEKTRFWIPKELAYNDMPGKPAGMLVFDVELLEIL